MIRLTIMAAAFAVWASPVFAHHEAALIAYAIPLAALAAPVAGAWIINALKGKEK